MGTWPRHALAVLLAAVALAGCSDGDTDGDTRPDTSAKAGPSATPPSASSAAPWEPQPSPTPVEDKRSRQVIADYQAYWKAVAEAEDPPQPAAKELAKRATGDELARIQAELAANELHEVSRTGRYLTNPVVVSLEDGRASVADCFTPYRWVKGEKRPQQPPPIPLIASLTLEGSVWQVAKTEPATHPCQPAATP